MEITFTKPRRAWLAALLSLLGGPLGQVYAGRLRRSDVLWFVGAFLLPIAAFASIFLPLRRFGFVFLFLCALAFSIYLAIDAFLLARRSRDAPLKRYQRWWFYVLLFVGFFIANQLVAHAVRSFVAEAFVVPTRSMAIPTFRLRLVTILAAATLLVQLAFVGGGSRLSGEATAPLGDRPPEKSGFIPELRFDRLPRIVWRFTSAVRTGTYAALTSQLATYSGNSERILALNPVQESPAIAL